MRFRAQTLLAHSLSGPISCTLIPPHQSLPTYPIVLCYLSVLSHQSLAPSLSFFPSFVPRPHLHAPIPNPRSTTPTVQLPGLHPLDSWAEWVGFPSCVCNSNFPSRLSSLALTFTHSQSHSLLIILHDAREAGTNTGCSAVMSGSVKDTPGTTHRTRCSFPGRRHQTRRSCFRSNYFPKS